MPDTIEDIEADIMWLEEAIGENEERLEELTSENYKPEENADDEYREKDIEELTEGIAEYRREIAKCQRKIERLKRAERERQNKKWGEQNHDDYRWLAILTEEVGELAQAILHDEFGGSHAGTAKTELVHVAAVAVQWLECMERRQLTQRAPDATPQPPLRGEVWRSDEELPTGV